MWLQVPLLRCALVPPLQKLPACARAVGSSVSFLGVLSPCYPFGAKASSCKVRGVNPEPSSPGGSRASSKNIITAECSRLAGWLSARSGLFAKARVYLQVQQVGPSCTSRTKAEESHPGLCQVRSQGPRTRPIARCLCCWGVGGCGPSGRLRGATLEHFRSRGLGRHTSD